MSRRCDREGVAWYRRTDPGADPICDPLWNRYQTRVWWPEDDPSIVVQAHHPYVAEHLRERPVLP